MKAIPSASLEVFALALIFLPTRLRMAALTSSNSTTLHEAERGLENYTFLTPSREVQKANVFAGSQDGCFFRFVELVAARKLPQDERSYRSLALWAFLRHQNRRSSESEHIS
jgi:hypothetical protein